MTQKELKDIVVYNPETGVFTWRYSHNGVLEGDPVYVQKKGKTAKTCYIKIKGKKYKVARLAWLYMHNTTPKVISHINGNLEDNRLCNLQDRPIECTPKQAPDEMTQEYLHKIMIYDPETGGFFWKVDRAANAKAGSAVFQSKSDGYRCITISNKTYRAHRLAWLYVYGTWPKVIDHINGDREDNRICNIRDTTARGNARNKKRHRDGKLVGTSYVKHINKWGAQVLIKHKVHIIGYFRTELEAHEAYKAFCVENNIW